MKLMAEPTGERNVNWSVIRSDYFSLRSGQMRWEPEKRLLKIPDEGRGFTGSEKEGLKGTIEEGLTQRHRKGKD